MATQLQLVNNVLRELRETEVAAINETDYSVLIAQFINRAKERLEDVNHHWSVYITEIDTTITADSSTIAFDLTATNDRSVLMRDTDNDLLPAAYDITANSVGQLNDFPYSDILRERALTADTTKTATIPRIFAIKADSDGRGWTIQTVWPVATGQTARSWRTYWYVPQAALALDDTDKSTVVKLPSLPIELWAIYLALNERGEEMGEPGGLAFAQAMDALGSSLERDQQVQRKPNSGRASDWNNEECL